MRDCTAHGTVSASTLPPRWRAKSEAPRRVSMTSIWRGLRFTAMRFQLSGRLAATDMSVISW